MSEKITKNQNIDEIIDNMSLMDDDLFGLVFDGNTEATALLLETILNRKDLAIVKVEGQKELRSPNIDGRKVRLDILAKDKAGRLYNLEVQRKNNGANEKRARFHSSMVDARMLQRGQDFTEINDSYVIFITENDYFRKGLPLYTINRHFEEFDAAFEDGSHILYVNGSYQGDDAIGSLIRDFRCKNAQDIQNEILARGVNYYKNEGGRKIMCESVERYANQKEIQGFIEAGISYGASKERIIEDLQKKFSISLEQAVEAYENMELAVL